MALTRPKSQELQTESFLAIEVIINSVNCEFKRIEPDNSGIDGEIELTENRKYIGRFLKCQIKAGISYISSESEEKIVIKVEKKYLEHWSELNCPVVLFYYKSKHDPIFWKSIKEYLAINKTLLKKESETVTITFDKERDIFESNFQPIFKLICEGKFEYEKYIFSDLDKEVLVSNWFEVLELPSKIYKSPTKFIKKRQITNYLQSFHSFIIKDSCIYTFSNLNNKNCELRKFCDVNCILTLKSIDIQKNYFVELLNSTLIINAISKGLVPTGEKFYMSDSELKNGSTNEFSFKPLIRNTESHRKKVYVTRSASGIIEYKHHALKMKFSEIGNNWIFELEPDWHFSYPNDKAKTARDIGIRITKEKANMFNKDYLYLLHALKQFLKNGNKDFVFRCDESEESQLVVIRGESLVTNSNFRIFNDYMKPKIEPNEN